MDKWEYTKFMINRTEDLIESLNSIGEDGWEIVRIEEIPYNPAHHWMSHKGIAKRRKD